jgi:hypothetical protein
MRTLPTLRRLSVVAVGFAIAGTLASAPAQATTLTRSDPPAPAAEAPVSLAASPHVRARTDGRVTHTDFPRTPAGLRLAKTFVHNRLLCGDALCTIQVFNNRYRTYRISRCDTFDLFNFRGRYDTHNHGSLTVHFLDARGRVIGKYKGDSRDPVRWNRVYAVRTCNR